jgi:hypothetical protein
MSRFFLTATLGREPGCARLESLARMIRAMSFKACGRGFKCLRLCGLLSVCITGCQSGGSQLVDRAMSKLVATRCGAYKPRFPNGIVTEAPAPSEADAKGGPVWNSLTGGDQGTSGPAR